MPKFMASFGTDQNVVGFSDLVQTVMREQSSIFSLIGLDPELGVNKAASAVWFDDYNQSPTTTLTANHLVGDTVLSVADSSLFAVNDVVHLGESGSNELALITATGVGTITVTRGYRATTATALTSGSKVLKVETLTNEGATPAAFTSRAADKRENYFATRSAKYGLTAESLNSRTWGEGDMDTKLAREQVRAITRLQETLAREIFYGVKSLGAAANPSAFDGLRKTIANADTANIQNVGGQLTETALNSRVEALVAKGGQPDVLFVHPSRMAALTTAGANRQATNRVETVLGMKVLMFQSASYGEIAIVRDLALAESDAVLVEWDKLGLSYREPWVEEPVATTGNVVERIIRSQVTLIHRNAAATGLWMTGVTA